MNKQTTFSTPDLCDEFEHKTGVALRVLEPVFRNFGGRSQFSGQVVTIKCFEDNSVLKQLLDQPGEGRVIVMDGGGSLRKAILGDLLAAKAVQNNWTGLLINGCIRDCDEIKALDIGVKAIAAHPQKTEKRGIGDLNVPVHFAGHSINPGDWLYADNNGVLIANQALLD